MFGSHPSQPSVFKQECPSYAPHSYTCPPSNPATQAPSRQTPIPDPNREPESASSRVLRSTEAQVVGQPRGQGSLSGQPNKPGHQCRTSSRIHGYPHMGTVQKHTRRMEIFKKTQAQKPTLVFINLTYYALHIPAVANRTYAVLTVEEGVFGLGLPCYDVQVVGGNAATWW